MFDDHSQLLRSKFYFMDIKGVSKKDRTPDQHHYRKILNILDRKPTRNEWKRTSVDFPFHNLTMQDFRGFYLSCFLVSRSGNSMVVRDRLCSKDQPLSLDRLLSRFKENKALRYIRRIMAERWHEAQGSTMKWRAFDKDYNGANIVDVVNSFRIYAGSTIGWHQDMHELMKETDFIYYNSRQDYIFVNVNYFTNWLNKYARRVIVTSIRDNLHFLAVKRELYDFQKKRVKYRNRYGLYVAGSDVYYPRFKKLSLYKIPIWRAPRKKKVTLVPS